MKLSFMEVLHSFYAQEIFKTLTPEEQEKLIKKTHIITLSNENELKYTKDIYGEIRLFGEVKDYVGIHAKSRLANP